MYKIVSTKIFIPMGKKTNYACFFLLGTLVGAGICALFFVGFTIWQQELDEKRIRDRLQKYTFHNGAVAADNKICSDIGRYFILNG